jgi:hypothetical protein
VEAFIIVFSDPIRGEVPNLIEIAPRDTIDAIIGLKRLVAKQRATAHGMKPWIANIRDVYPNLCRVGHQTHLRASAMVR